MDLQADITWIQKEIANIKDPELIAVFKSLLKYRDKKSSEETLDSLLDRAFDDIEAGRTTPHDTVMKKFEKWL